MVHPKILGAVAVAALATACTSIKEVRTVQPTGTPFTQALAREYRDLAVFESDEMFDYIDATFFAQKGIDAAKGNVVAPADPAQWKLTEAFRPEAVASRARLVAALDRARETNPAAAARAQVKYDCWIEQNEEDFQEDHIAACRDEFLGALQAIEARPVAAAAPAPAPAPAAPRDVAPTPAPAPAAPPPPAAPVTFIIFFDLDKSTITTESSETLKLVKEEIDKRRGTARLDLTGYTDTSGSNAYNMGLSLRRADAAVAELTRSGVTRTIISASARGEENLRKKTADGVVERENRRVELTVR